MLFSFYMILIYLILILNPFKKYMFLCPKKQIFTVFFNMQKIFTFYTIQKMTYVYQIKMWLKITIYLRRMLYYETIHFLFYIASLSCV